MDTSTKKLVPVRGIEPLSAAYQAAAISHSSQAGSCRRMCVRHRTFTSVWFADERCLAPFPYQVIRIVKERDSSNDESRGTKKAPVARANRGFSFPGRKATCGQPSDALFTRLSNQNSKGAAALTFRRPSGAAIVGPTRAAIEKCIVITSAPKRVMTQRIVFICFHRAADFTPGANHCQQRFDIWHRQSSRDHHEATIATTRCAHIERRERLNRRRLNVNRGTSPKDSRVLYTVGSRSIDASTPAAISRISVVRRRPRSAGPHSGKTEFDGSTFSNRLRLKGPQQPGANHSVTSVSSACLASPASAAPSFCRRRARSTRSRFS